MSPIKPAPKRSDAKAQNRYLDSVTDKLLEFSTPKHKRHPAPRSTLHLETWDEITPSAHDHIARIGTLAGAGNPSSDTLAIEGAPTRVLPRQYAETSTIPAYYGALYSSPSPGAVVGITLGAVAGFILILFLIYTCINLGGYSTTISESAGTASVVTRRSRHHYRSAHHSEVEDGGGRSRGVYKHRRSSRRRSRSTSSAGDDRGETVEIRRTAKTTRDHRGREHGHGHGDGIVLEERHRSRSIGQGHGQGHPHGEPVAQRIVVEERRRSSRRQSRTAARSRSPPRPIVVEASEPSHPHERERIVVEEDVSSVSSPPGPPRRRRSSGYREIRPGEFAGGDELLREVRRSRSISRHRE
ncbi:hypothetical protein QBC32DRAFT_79758 [Pseudoneurospora amorphoporcata]|uniref:Uncharacterized protein n=1 Tax=Pseudoneurospora amorphoporcata TaxID=241081 RepID=A0AAN6NYV2_9PEZI|nr:hypothetical protein QBC32DRAFT_79758 [Pseudoneurospora amorphoporcata]